MAVDALANVFRSLCVCVQSLASAASFVYSMHLLMHWQLLIMVTMATVGTVMFFEAERLAIVRAKRIAAEAKLAIQSSS